MWDFRRPIVAYDGQAGAWAAGGNAPAFNAGLLNAAPVPGPGIAAAPDSDILIVRAPARDGQLLRLQPGFSTSAAPTSPYQVVPPAAGTEPQTGDVMLITDCQYAGVFKVTGFAANQISHNSGGAAPANVDDPANPFVGLVSPAWLAPMRTAIYFLAPSTPVPPAAVDASRLSLWRRISNPAAGQPALEELVDGVESMQVQAMVADGADGRTTRVLNPRNVARWEDVAAVQIALLVRTPDEDGTLLDTQTYPLLDEPALGPFNDRRQRMVFNTTATVRNWVP
jgi:hypothetical protein